MNKLVVIIFMVAATFIWYGLESGNVDATITNKIGSDYQATNLTRADLTGADLTGVKLNGVILCNTIMPDRTINNSGCKD
jgi:uncharacterized protein YjbI with pentapeptide repeats